MAIYIMESQYYGTEALILMRRHEIIFSLLKKKNPTVETNLLPDYIFFFQKQCSMI